MYVGAAVENIHNRFIQRKERRMLYNDVLCESCFLHEPLISMVLHLEIILEGT